MFNAAFTEALERGPGGATCAEDWLCGMAVLELELATPLGRWRADRSCEAALALAHFVLAHAESLRDGRGATQGFWEVVAPAAQLQVGTWLGARETVAQLQIATALLPPEENWEIEQSLSVLAGPG